MNDSLPEKPITPYRKNQAPQFRLKTLLLIMAGFCVLFAILSAFELSPRELLIGSILFPVVSFLAALFLEQITRFMGKR